MPDITTLLSQFLNSLYAGTAFSGTVGNGTAGAPSIGFASAPTTGMYLIGAGNMGFSAVGVGAAQIIGGSGVIVPAGSRFAWNSGAINTAIDTGLSRVDPGTVGTTVGTGTAVASVGGVLHTNITPASTTGTIEETLMQYTLPANTLTTNGRGVRITVFGTTVANANAKNIKVYFGSSLGAGIQTSTSGVGWRLSAEVLRTGASAEAYVAHGWVSQGSTFFMQAGTLAEALASTVLIKITGTTPTLLGDVTATGLIVEAL